MVTCENPWCSWVQVWVAENKPRGHPCHALLEGGKVSQPTPNLPRAKNRLWKWNDKLSLGFLWEGSGDPNHPIVSRSSWIPCGKRRTENWVSAVIALTLCPRMTLTLCSQQPDTFWVTSQRPWYLKHYLCQVQGSLTTNYPSCWLQAWSMIRWFKIAFPWPCRKPMKLPPSTS